MAQVTNFEKEVAFNKPKTIVETVAEFLRESIVAGSLKPGEKINNKEIIKRLGISSIPFREAVRVLEKEGLIVSRTGRGSWVASASRKDLEETFEMREMLETFAVDLIERREKVGSNVKEKLKSIALDKEAESLGPESCVSFHHYIIQLADNRKLLYLYDILTNNIRRYQRMSYTIRHEEKLCVKEHLDIIEALIKGDYERAKLAIKGHLKGLKDKLLKQVEFSE
jgi:DNA-binding GntR family transcriptional regulator